MARDQEELIKLYENRLEKVKAHHNPKKANSSILKEKCDEYIKFAKQELKAVKDGRNW